VPAPSSATSPRYVEIAAHLRERILSQQLGPHTLLPSERELSEQHAVSRMTARQALTLLESEGYVYRRPPRGTFVAEPRVRFRIGSFSREAGRLGRQATAELLWAKQLQPDRPTQAALGLAPGDPVHGFHRLRLMEGEPIALETTYFPAALTDGILQMPADGSLWSLLKDDFGVEVTRSDAVIESMILDEHACALLRVRAASPGILLTRRSFDADGRCVEYARDVYRADRAAFEVSAAVSV
jgi:GntR family transcriptional regulator